MIYAQLGNLRLATIYQLVDVNTQEFKPTDVLYYGLHLEATSNGGENWYAIAKIIYDDGCYKMESVGPRLMNTLSEDNLDDVKFLCNYAVKLFRKLKAEERKECSSFYWSDEMEEE